MAPQLTVFGGRGFVGSEFVKLHPDAVVPARDERVPATDDVVYFISTVHNYHVHEDPLLDVRTNLVVLLEVLAAHRARGGQGCFDFISSWFVYGQDSGFGPGARGIPETSSCDPRGFYSITKRAAEQLLVSYCETFGLRYRILRLANVLGPGDTKASAQKNALQFLLERVRRGEPVDLYDGGQFYRDYVDVRDCARAIDLVVSAGAPNEIYNVGNGRPVVFGDVVAYGKRRLGSPSELRTIEQKSFHKTVQASRSFFLDTTKLAALGYAPRYTWEQTIDHVLGLD